MKAKTDLEKTLDTIFASDASELDKLAASFEATTASYLAEYQREIEIHKALNDAENLLKARIQRSMIESARGMFAHCYLKSTGRAAWQH